MCGELDSIFTIDDSATWNCEDNVCTFDCGQDFVNLEEVVCDPTTGQWVTGETTQIECLNVCTEFGGSKTDFIIHQDVLIFCNDQPDGTNRCDLFCPGDEIQLRVSIQNSQYQAFKLGFST